MKINRNGSAIMVSFIIIMMIIMPVSGLEFMEQPPSNVSISYNTEYTFIWEVKTNEPMSDLDVTLTGYEIDNTKFDECSSDIDYDASSKTNNYKTGSTDSGSSVKFFLMVESTLSSDLSVRASNGEFESDAAFGSSDNPFLCEVWELKVVEPSDKSITSNPVTIKIYESNDKIPSDEKINNQTNGMLTPLLIIGGVSFVIIILMVISPAKRV